jgi:uncharacterized protein YjbI with pentapeptide repeats
LPGRSPYFQLQFLPHHSEWITSWQRVAVVIDLVLLWILWPSIARGETARFGWNDFRRIKVLASLLASALPVLLVVTIATFPGEWLEENLPPVRFIPTTWVAATLPRVEGIQTTASGRSTLHELLVAGEVNYVTGRPQSLWSNVLVLPNFEIGDRVKSDAEGKIAISSNSVSLRGRSLEGVILASAHLRNADFTGASLARANFIGADLREAKFECEQIGGSHQHFSEQGHKVFFFQGHQERDAICAELRGAYFEFAQLQGASLVGAQLQGAYLTSARLQDASLHDAQLQGAELPFARLQGASLGGTQLQGADLRGVQLGGANLYQAQLQGASLIETQLQGASLIERQLQGATLMHLRLDGALLSEIFVWRTVPFFNQAGAFVDAPQTEPKYSGLDCPVGKHCDWSETSFAALKSLIKNSVPAGPGYDQALRQIAELEKPPYAADEALAKAWTDRAKESAARSADSYFNTLAKIFKKIGCAADGAPYVIGGLLGPGRIYANAILNYRFEGDSRYEGNLSEEAEVAGAFLDEAKCPGARGLSEENKAKLREIRDRGLPAPPGPGAAAR